MDGLYQFAPEVGMNICYAKEGTQSLQDVAGVAGRIMKVGNRIRALGSVEYGASKHIATIILAAMSQDNQLRAAMNIKYRPEIIEGIERTGGFAISSFDRSAEPKDKSTMEWGTIEAIRSLGRVPDLIYDRGGIGKEPMIRILGKGPSDVVSKLRRIIGAADGL
ncbi:MAG: thiamine-phosphate synthase family protein [Candidatus Hydrothermarchaeales archaeon]